MTTKKRINAQVIKGTVQRFLLSLPCQLLDEKIDSTLMSVATASSSRSADLSVKPGNRGKGLACLYPKVTTGCSFVINGQTTNHTQKTIS